MKQWTSFKEWLIKQFRTKPIPSYIISASVGVLLILGVMYAFGAFGSDDIDQRGFRYLPDREYVLGAKEDENPQNLQELLYSANPSVEDLLKNPNIAEELLEAEDLVDVVDSRYTLNNLRDLGEQLEDRSQEEDVPMGDLVTVSSAPAEKKKPEKEVDPEDPAEEAKSYMPEPATSEPQKPVEKTESAKKLDEAAEEIDTDLPTEPSEVRNSYNNQQELVDKLNRKVDQLLAVAEYGDWQRLPSTINMKGIWQNPGESMLHFVPEADWIPEEGYKIFRQIGDQKVLIKEGAAAQTTNTKAFTSADNEMVQGAYQAAQFTQSDAETLDMDEEVFADTVYRVRTMDEPQHLNGEADFLLMKKAMITIPDGFDQKIPQSDKVMHSPVFVMNLPENGRYEAGAIRTKVWESFTVEQAELPYGIQTLAVDEVKYQSALETLEARQQIATMSFVDDEFAEEAGFLIKDDLKELNLKDGDEITYVLEAPGGKQASVKLNWGTELNLTKPDGFMGYGLDGKVSLRWREPANAEEHKITSGYNIERKLEDESEFKKINEKPVVVSEVMDKTGVFFESPVLFQDMLENGTKAQYRIYSIDIFGRKSDYSDVIDIHVEKVTPPDAPTTASITLAEEAPQEADNDLDRAILEAVQANHGKKGIVIPIFNESGDTVRFTLYRAEAIGVGSYSDPEPLANFNYENPKAGESDKEGTLPGFVPEDATKGPTVPQPQKLSQAAKYGRGKVRGSRHLLLQSNTSKAPDMVYFDSKVEKGVTYKYWVSAWDSWNNESAWSKSATSSVPSEVEPQVPKTMTVAMMARELPDLSTLSPGLVHDQNVSETTVLENDEKPKRQSAENTSIVSKADLTGAEIGNFLTHGMAPAILSVYFDNLPEQKYIHMFLGVQSKDVLPDGTARLRWPAYSGDDLGGYAIYQSKVDKPLGEDVKTKDREELLAMGQWTKLTSKALEQNQFVVQGLDPNAEEMNIFLICLEPQESPAEEMPVELARKENESGAYELKNINHLLENLHISKDPEGGFVSLSWEEPEDLQLKYYRVYRSEVENFKKPVDESKLEWTLVGDQVFGPQYTDPVEQSHAHYYYYKVTSVSPWGVESKLGVVEKIRVPSTKPPQTPNLLMPLSRKDGIQVNFSAVQYCSRYEVYRTEIPKIDMEKLKNLNTTVLESLFTTPTNSDRFLSTMLSEGVKASQGEIQQAQVNALSRFKTVNLASSETLTEALGGTGDAQRQEFFSKLVHEFGPLALAEYRDLSVSMMGLVKWEKIAELPVDENTKEMVDPDTGLLKPLSVIDYDAKFGTFYLYTVQAWNDDELGSTRPEPIEATPRRNRPFDPIDGLEGWCVKDFNDINLQWNPAKMEGLSPEQCLEDTVGYIVYYSTEKDGDYVQASPLQFTTSWVDVSADQAATNWYKVRVLDTGGYLSDFSEPILVRQDGVVELPRTQIPETELYEEGFEPPAAEAPKLSMDDPRYVVEQGQELRIPFRVTGTEPISYETFAVHSAGQDEAGIIVPEGKKEVYVPATMKAGGYKVTLSAINAAGRDDLTFDLYIHEKQVQGNPPVLNLEKDRLELTAYYGGELKYTLSGDEPIRYTYYLARININQPNPTPVTEMMKLDSDNKVLIFSEDLGDGEYKGYLIAENSFGKDRKDFSLSVKSKIALGELQHDLVSYTCEPTSAYEAASAEEMDWQPKIVPLVNDTINRDLMKDLIKDQIRLEEADKNFLVLEQEYSSKTADYYGFSLEDVSLKRALLNLKGNPKGYVGTAKLVFPTEGGNKRSVPVNIINVEVVEKEGKTSLLLGSVYIDKPYEFEDLGVTLSSLVINEKERGKASGYVRSVNKGKNLFGNRTGFLFENAPFRSPTLLVILPQDGRSTVMPPVKHGQISFEEVKQVNLRLDADQDTLDFIEIFAKNTLKAPLETLNNEGIPMIADSVAYDIQGRLSTYLYTKSEEGEFLQLLVPGGSGLKIRAGVQYIRGEATDAGWIGGKLILPFEKADEQGPGIPGNYAGSHPTSSDMDIMMIPDFFGKYMGINSINDYLIHFGQTVQKNGLLIVPDDPKLQEGCAYAEFALEVWRGEGFVIDSAELTPVRVAERSLAIKQQRKQAIIVTPTEITIDLDRESFLPGKKDSQTPRETEEPFWVGLVMKGGTLQLPTDFIQSADNKPIFFQLAEGEMIYDLNGFNYQTLLYNPAGVPASFGSALGGFEDVTVFDCLLDMYANKVNLEINAEVGLELFNNNRVKVKLYTNKEDNEDGKAGEFLCSVAPCIIEQFAGAHTKLTIDGGFLEEAGMRIGGAMELATEELQIKEPMMFSTMIIPAKRTQTNEELNKNKQYAWATLDKEVPVHMQGFELAIREINFEYMASEEQPGVPTRLSLWGAVMLSEEIPLGSETTDRIVMDTLIDPNNLIAPKLIYDHSFSVLDTNFDECIDVKGVLVPKLLDENEARKTKQVASFSPPGVKTQSQDDEDKQKYEETKKKVDEKLGQIQQGLIEFETENLELGFLGSLGELPIDTITRFGYDVDNKRCYFVVGMLEKEGGEPLNLGVGGLKDFSGLVVNNMVVERDDQMHLVFPKKKDEMKELVHNMPVQRESGGQFAAAIRGTLVIKKVCEVRDLYFGFEQGPLVEASGGLYLPLDVEVILNPSSDGFKHVGDVSILYSHPERYFSFSMTLNEIDMVAIKLSGSLGFEWSPKLFGVYVGYPETLAGNVSFYRVGLGLGFRIADDGANIIKGKVEFGFQRDVRVAIVYLGGYVYAGADGGYYANYNDTGEPKFILTLYLKGGLEGGIIVGRKRFNIISLYLDARGTLESLPPSSDWKLTCSAKVSYSLNLFLFSVSGSVSASFDTTL